MKHAVEISEGTFRLLGTVSFQDQGQSAIRGANYERINFYCVTIAIFGIAVSIVGLSKDLLVLNFARGHYPCQETLDSGKSKAASTVILVEELLANLYLLTGSIMGKHSHLRIFLIPCVLAIALSGTLTFGGLLAYSGKIFGCWDQLYILLELTAFLVFKVISFKIVLKNYDQLKYEEQVRRVSDNISEIINLL